MWHFRMYEWLAAERIASYHREAARDRRFRFDTPEPSRTPTPEATAPAPSTRRALAAAFVGLAAIGALRRRR